MHGSVPPSGEGAISFTPTIGTDKPFTPTSGSDDWDWFAPVAWTVLGTKDPGAILHLVTGYPISTCRAYVAKDRDSRRAPTLQFLRKLCQSDHGAPFLAGFMHGCAAPWWIESQRDIKRAAAAQRFRAELDRIDSVECS